MTVSLRHPEKKVSSAPLMRKPPWLRVRAPSGKRFLKTSAILKMHRIPTVCQEASCPNIGECWNMGHATFMIMGSVCTRACAFCDVMTGIPKPLDPTEPRRIAQAVEELKLKHVVITSVDRDDLPDGGAKHFGKVVASIRERLPSVSIEILTPDFLRKQKSLSSLFHEGQVLPDVFNHNVETVPRLYAKIRPGARYFHSLHLLARAKEKYPILFTKSGMMVGLGETLEEILQVMDDLRAAHVDFLTIGQYLQPSRKHAPVKDYLEPDVFERLGKHARSKGFSMVSSTPLTRSSYHAGDAFLLLKKARQTSLKTQNRATSF